MALAAYLNINYKFYTIEDADSRRAMFIFEDDGTTLQEEAKKFYQDEAIVNPREYFDSLRIMKSNLYNQRENKHY